jgi:phage/plasmid-like protein (TIGR03299 family)
MAHEVETMMSARGIKPWHFTETSRTGQTVVVDHAPGAEEAIKLAQLDWQVDLEPVYTKSKAGGFREVKDRFALVRDADEKSLGVVSSMYHPLQNRDAFQFLDNLVDEGLEYETAGSLRGGETVFVTAKLPREILIGGEDAHELYLFVRNSHNGRHAVRVGVTPIRVVCQNTMNLAMGNLKRSWSCPHVGTMKGRLQEAREALELTWTYVEAFEQRAEELVATKISDAAFEDFLEECLKTPLIGPKAKESADAGIRGLYRNADTIGQFKGTAWGALNAVGEYFDWYRESTSNEARLLGSIEGTSARMRDRALALL